MYLRLAHYFCSTECVRSLLVCQSRAIRIVSRRSGNVVADDGPRLRPTDWAERNFHELTEIFAGCGIITCVAAFTAHDAACRCSNSALRVVGAAPVRGGVEAASFRPVAVSGAPSDPNGPAHTDAVPGGGPPSFP